MRLVILGAGGHGCTVADVARQTGEYSEIIFLDDHYEAKKQTVIKYGPNNIICEMQGVCGDYKKYIDDNTEIYPAFGNNVVRLEWQRKIKEDGGKLPIIIHPTAYVAESAVIHPGTVVLPRAIINTGCLIEKACIINAAAIVDHGCYLHSGVHVNVGAIVMAENSVPETYTIGAGEIIAWRQWPIDKN